MNKRFALVGLVAGPLVAVGILAAGPAKAAETKNTEDTYQLLNLLGDVFERVRTDYVEQKTDQDLIEAAIVGMLTALDPHSSYLNAKNFREMQVETKGEFGGLGIEVTMETGLVKVVSPIDETPAARAGLQPGDLINTLNGEPVQGLTLTQAVEKMRGKVGTDIRLGILREGRDPFEVTITRAVIKIRSVRSRVVDNDIGYLRITRFSEQTDKGLKKAVAKLEKESDGGLKGYVLDLRNNPGGLLDQAVNVSDAFLNQGEIVSTRARREDETQRFNARKGDVIEGKPMVVLINGGSASASEIVAGALKDHRRAVVMGTKSFGKGSVQTIIPLPGHGAMRLTTARYYTPSGNSIQARGIEPDIIVNQARIEDVDQPQRTREADLRGALDATGRNGSDPKDAEDKGEEGEAGAAAPAEVQDYQLSRAVDLLRGLSIFEQTVQN